MSNTEFRQIHVRIKEKDFMRLKQIADFLNGDSAENMTASKVFRIAVREYLANWEEKIKFED